MKKPVELPVCGLAAVQSLYSKNPDSIKRLYFDAVNSKRVPKISKHMAASKRVYRVVEPAELAKISGTMHHGGIVAIIEEKQVPELTREQVQVWAREARPVLVLDRVGNAHNLGALVRTAAHLGVTEILIADSAEQARPGEAAHRVAEGGMEHVNLFRVGDLPGALRYLATSHEVIGTAVEGAKSLKNLQRKKERPVALVLGNEEHGMSKEVAAACTHLVTIPGTGNVESLNVSVAGAILLWSLVGNCR